MSLSTLFYSASIHILAAPAPGPTGGGGGNVPMPDPGGDAPAPLISMVKTGLNLLAWAGTAAGVAGVLLTGTMMAISARRGEGSEHMGRLGLVLGGCILVATAGPLVQWVFNNSPS